jgi:3-hydroxyisobutyrate dehydrogenase
MSVDQNAPGEKGVRKQPQGTVDPTAPRPRIAFIGLGRIGARMAWRLSDAGFDLSVYDADQRAMDRFGATRIRRYRSPEAVALDCSIVVTALPSVSVASNVLRAAAPAAGSLVIEMSADDPEAVRGLAATLAERSVSLVDAAVSGSTEQAAAGTLSMLVGGEPDPVTRALPVLELLAKRVMHCGPVGSGVAMRALNSLVTAIDFAATIEAMQIGCRYGLDPKLMLDVFNSSTGTNHATAEEIAPFVLTGRFNSGLSLQQLVREATAALGVARTTKTDVPLCRTAGELWRMAEAGLEPGADHTALARWYEHRSGTRLRS